MSEIHTTNIPQLDKFLGGGLRTNSITLLWACPGIDNTPFTYQMLIQELESGSSCVYISQSKMSSIVESEIEHYGWNIEDYRNRGDFIFIDAYSSLINAHSDDEFFVSNAREVEEITKALKKALDATGSKHTFVVYDSISTMIDHCGEKSMDELKIWKKLFEENNATGAFLFTEWPYDDDVLDRLRVSADAIVELKAIEEKVILREFFVVSKVDWSEKTGKDVSVPFKISAPGGVSVYIPKILVTGAFNAGKSSFVHSASTRAVSVDRVGTTVALDHGRVEYAGFTADLFGTPGQERFDPILKQLGGESLGVIAVVDSTNPDKLPRVKEMLIKSKSAGLPCVIAANKADLPGALSPDEIRTKMMIPETVHVIPVRAKDLSEVREGSPAELKEEDVHKVLDSLFASIV